ncbi:MAG: AMP-binding protein [Gammaproteobacteria bacterium]|nr:AMP-binding protein [Gammaproteobacteria bacterium]
MSEERMPSDLQIVLPQERIKEMARMGLWPMPLAIDYLDGWAEKAPDRVAVTGYNSMRGTTSTVSYRQLKRCSERIALGLAAHGVEKGDIVSYQLPNWWEFTALHLACVRIGAITNPVMPIFRQRELSFMLGLAESKLLVVPRVFRGFDYPAMVDSIRPDLPALEHVFVLGGEDEHSFEATFLERRWEDQGDAGSLFDARRPDPNDVIEVLYTSGTTGEPKGVMHTSNTLFSNVRALNERIELGDDDVILMSSPMAHQTGFLYGMLAPIVLGVKVVLQDIWSAEEAIRLIQDEGVTFTMASTPFLSDVAESAAVDQYDVSGLHTFLTAGAPIPRVLVQKARERLDIMVMSAWGMTENGAITTTRLQDSEDKISSTDGIALRDMEVKVVDSDGKPAPTDQEGLLKARGPGSFVGYLKRADLYGTDDEGWFDTGDLACMDADGYIRISGRAKDVIIRGGENVPVVEVEELLYRHADIETVAVVAMPDPRLGERGCAFVTLCPGASLTFEEMIAHLEALKITKTYLPERLEILEELPRTPSGKIQKFQLREIASRFTNET